MKKHILAVVLGFAICVVAFISFWYISSDEKNVISWCEGDVDADGMDETLIITGNGTIKENGKKYGDYLLICKKIDKDQLQIGKSYKNATIISKIDLKRLKPMKIQLGDIDGDGQNEISICVFKTTKFHPTPATRPFFYKYSDGALVPVWLGSRLSRPFESFILLDIDDNGLDEIVSVEYLEDSNRIICSYNWKGFGFEVLAESPPIDSNEEISISPHGKMINVTVGKETYDLELKKNGENSELIEVK